MVHPAPGLVEKGIWDLIRSWFTSKKKLEEKIEQRDQRIRELEAELEEELSGRLRFEKQKSELEMHPGDEPMYWKKDGDPYPFCHLCVDSDHKFIHLSGSEGNYYCSIHQQSFETRERRERIRQYTERLNRPNRPPRSGIWS
jgi:hypothetical protein